MKEKTLSKKGWEFVIPSGLRAYLKDYLKLRKRIKQKSGFEELE